MKHVELISTGNELLNGRTANTHAQTLGNALAGISCKLSRDTTIPDEIDSIIGAIDDAFSRTDLVILSGGLGPTPDDLTRDAVAQYLGRSISTDPDSLENVRRYFLNAVKDITPAAERHALIVDGAQALKNPVGLAPGEQLEIDKGVLFLLPGPPHEFRAILEDYILPWMNAQDASADDTPECVFMTSGLGESTILQKLEERGLPNEAVSLAFCAAPGRVEIRLRPQPGKGRQLEESRSTVREMFQSHIFAEEQIYIEAAVARKLIKAGETLAVAESCTGGLIGARLTSLSGSSAFFKGGILCYSNESKIRDLAVSPETIETHGAVSEEAALELAAGAKARFESDYAISVTGIAGPAGGTKEKPVGLVHIAIASPTQLTSTRHVLTGDRSLIREKSVQSSLFHLYQSIQS